MPAVDAWRTSQMLMSHISSAPGGRSSGRSSVSEDEFVFAVRSVFERFHMLAATVKDYAAIWLIFSNVLEVVQYLIALPIVLAVFVPNEVLHTLAVTASTAFLGLSFVFGSLLREMFESLVLILVVHPYDVGDRIRVGSEMYTVQKINILVTEACDLKTNQCVYLKNASLYNEAKFVNLGRSLNAVVELSFDIGAAEISEVCVCVYVYIYIYIHIYIYIYIYM